ncbi:RES family NAD+ phosphorylase [Streptomyces sp. NBC_01261]|uniref:RES family NAD+ phosphorylase n=1 Tax=Streptomyces sp. NBC_01261 TaxID=2903802 RepID=UPI003FCDD942
MSEPTLQLAQPNQRLSRVAWTNHPLRPSRGDPNKLALADAGNRFDSPVADFGVLYCGTGLQCCFGEILADFRPSPKVLALTAGDRRFKAAGTVPQGWREDHVSLQIEITDIRPFVDVEAGETHAILTPELASVLVDLGIGHLNVASVRGPDRRLTRALAQWVHDQRDAAGKGLYAGIRYLSKHDTQWECWAVFDDASYTMHSQDNIARDDAALQAVADRFGLLVY